MFPSSYKLNREQKINVAIKERVAMLGNKIEEGYSKEKLLEIS